jgi:hypothetical protein
MQARSDQKVVARQQLLQALVKPVGSLFMLAGRAVAVAAGAVSGMQLAAGLAFIETGAEAAAAAVNDGLDGFAVVLGQVLSMEIKVLRGIAAEDLLDGIHGVTVCIKSLMMP